MYTSGVRMLSRIPNCQVRIRVFYVKVLVPLFTQKQRAFLPGKSPARDLYHQYNCEATLLLGYTLSIQTANW